MLSTFQRLWAQIFGRKRTPPTGADQFVPNPDFHAAAWEQYTSYKTDLLQGLSALREIAENWQPEDRQRLAHLQRMYEDLRADVYQVMVIGAFKRGKSRFINALLRRPGLLPTAVQPLTRAVTEIRCGDDEYVEVQLKSGNPEGIDKIRDSLANLGLYVAEGAVRSARGRQATDEHRAGRVANYIGLVTIFCNSTLLHDGLRLFDTPGVSSTDEGHTTTTMSALPFADLCLFLVDVSVPLGKTELDFLELAYALNPHILFVLTKIDQRPNPSDWQVASDRIRTEVRQYIGIQEPEVHAVSSRWAEEAIDPDAALDRYARLERWERSGFPLLERSLAYHLGQRRLEMKIRSVLSKCQSIGHTMAAGLALELASIDKTATELEMERQAWEERLRIASAERDRIQSQLIDQSNDVIRSLGEKFDDLKDRFWIEFASEVDMLSEAQMASPESCQLAVQAGLTRAAERAYNVELERILRELRRIYRTVLEEFRSGVLGSLQTSPVGVGEAPHIALPSFGDQPLLAQTLTGTAAGGLTLPLVLAKLLGGAAIKVLLPAVLVGAVLGGFAGYSLGDMWRRLIRMIQGSQHERIKQVVKEQFNYIASSVHADMESQLSQMTRELFDQLDRMLTEHVAEIRSVYERLKHNSEVAATSRMQRSRSLKECSECLQFVLLSLDTMAALEIWDTQ